MNLKLNLQKTELVTLSDDIQVLAQDQMEQVAGGWTEGTIGTDLCPDFIQSCRDPGLQP